MWWLSHIKSPFIKSGNTKETLMQVYQLITVNIFPGYTGDYISYKRAPYVHVEGPIQQIFDNIPHRCIYIYTYM